MISSLNFNPSLAAASLLLSCVVVSCAAGEHAVAQTATNATAILKTGAAAVVDGHVIPMDEVIIACLRKYRHGIIDQTIQGYVADCESQRCGLKIDESEIDRQIAQARTNLAPETLEDALKKHQMTLAELRDQLRQKLEIRLLVADQIKPVKMLHCREICIRYGPASQTGLATNRTEAQALAIINGIQEQLEAGKEFEPLAAQLSEPDNNGQKDDLGVLHKDSMTGVEAPVQEAALKLRKGQLSEVIKSDTGFHILKVVSTDDDHPAAENEAYKNVEEEARLDQSGRLETENIARLINNSQMAFVKNSDLVPGKPLPETAAVIDGHPIPMKDVVRFSMVAGGRRTLDILIQNYLVDRECERRGIKISDVEIDARIEKLKKDIAPMTLEEGLKQHQTTLEKLKYDFRQELERTQLAEERVAPPEKLVHARIIFVKVTPDDARELLPGPKRTDAEAKVLAADILKQFKAGKDFGALARQYSESPEKDKGGDMGILYEGKNNLDTAMLNTALGLKSGDTTPEPVKGFEGYFIVQIVSTSDNHTKGEDALYAAGLEEYKTRNAGAHICEVIRDLVNKSKVVYRIE